MTTPRPINGVKGWATVIIAAVISGTGGSIVLPQVAPSWYRSDPYYGKQGAELEKQVAIIRDDLDDVSDAIKQFLILGPQIVRANQEEMKKMIERLEHKLLMLLGEMRRQQEAHQNKTHIEMEKLK